jgi:hypothetical protein
VKTIISSLFRHGSRAGKRGGTQHSFILVFSYKARQRRGKLQNILFFYILYTIRGVVRGRRIIARRCHFLILSLEGGRRTHRRYEVVLAFSYSVAASLDGWREEGRHRPYSLSKDT